MNNPKHFVIDMFDCCKQPLKSTCDVENYLRSVVRYLGLVAMSYCHLHKFLPDGHPDNDGVTASLILTTSLISIHTYPRERACYIDLFACTDYSQDDFLEFSKSWFKGKTAVMRPVPRMKYTRQFSEDYKDRRKNFNYHFGIESDSDPEVNNYGIMY